MGKRSNDKGHKKIVSIKELINSKIDNKVESNDAHFFNPSVIEFLVNLLQDSEVHNPQESGKDRLSDDI